MKHKVAIFALVVGALAGREARAQSGGAQAAAAQKAVEDRARIENSKKWATEIEKLRAQSPPPPLPQIKFPSPNEVLLAKLRSAEDPKRSLAEYLDKLWKDGKDAAGRRGAFEQFWHDAEKPKWARAATEDYFHKHANEPLKQQQPPPPPAVASP